MEVWGVVKSYILPCVCFHCGLSEMAGRSFCLYENLAIVARFRGALAVSVEGNKKILTC